MSTALSTSTVNRARLIRYLLGKERQQEAALPIVALKRDDTTPLSFAQERLWLLEQISDYGGAYNIPVSFRLTGSLDVGVLEQTLTALVERHEVLRTRFVMVEGQGLQIVDPPSNVVLQVEDLRDVEASERELTAQHLLTAEAARPFDLAVDPGLRVLLVRLSDDEYVLSLVVHHIASDGWSMGIMVQEIGALYQAFLEGRGSPLPALAVQYADYAIWQRAWLQGEV
ncbi:condensation domain-containing protein, partial [Rhizobium leguminosarum]|uniref:condensation domain-containing protein n=1 Tax=Rhizobium leguminosarum TaxID=384 RepID=UPI003F98BA6F